MRLARDFLIILACLQLGKGVAALLPFGFPGSIIGLFVLFMLLSLQLIRLNWVHDGGQLILRHMALLFIPVAVGLLGYLDVLSDGLWLIIGTSLAGLVLILLCVGHLYQRWSR
ncbi:CidA/LrgA family protein [Zobellella maritima]|uniref:CidA/LrgA family protein n=1 Tax=Zobellella maritima TaxID=2059725 RepID=UPI000E306853|nr:CidA/LrgA family protein [Zobellella maritima]